MNYKEIFLKAIDKAAKNGFLVRRGLLDYAVGCLNANDFTGCYHIVFSHEFSEAFFGEPKPIITKHFIKAKTITRVVRDGVISVKVPAHYAGKRKSGSGKSWRKHLQEMVLEKNPLEYLSKFI